MRAWRTLPCLLGGLALAGAYEVPISDKNFSDQVCSGMWGGKEAGINVTFESSSQGQLAMVIYEWADNDMLGKVTSMIDDTLPKTYICTTDAVRGGYCDSTNLGRFILDFPAGVTQNETSFWTARVGFRDNDDGSSSSSGSGSDSDSESSDEDEDEDEISVRQDESTESGADILWYSEPIHYPVRKTGFYCVATVPITVLPTDTTTKRTTLSLSRRQADTDVPFHPPYNGVVLFRNTFDGKLPASDYPKLNFYFGMFLAYAVLGGLWVWLCLKYKEELLPIQYYLSSLVALVVIDMVANWAYYRYLNAHGRGTAATAFLIVVAILDAGRNALSFFMLLVVCLGLSVVRESLGPTMLRCQLLGGAHFIFGVLYSIGIVELELESTSAFILIMFIFPLALTLSGFLCWILYALNGTINQLAARKQRYKLSMFKNLHRILLGVVLVICIFFVVSTMMFSSRMANDFSSNFWKVRWMLLDGWLAILYLLAFSGICYLWRPTPHNRRLAMSEELAQEDEDAEDYDMEALERRSRLRNLETGEEDDDDDATLVAGRRGGVRREPVVGDDAVVFEIGDHEEDEDEVKSPEGRRHKADEEDDDRVAAHEREGLMGRREHQD